MRGRIPQSFIDNLLDRVDIVDLIDARVALKRAGRNYKGLCPFHQEKTASFTVNGDKQFYYCFGCGAGGNAISFLMDYERLDFPTAIESLARHAGLEIPRVQGEGPDPRREQEPLFDVLQRCSSWYQRQLRAHADAGNAVAYLKQRGLTGVIAKRFGIGFAPAGWDNLLQAAGGTAAERELLIKAGMLVTRDNGQCYDRFRERIMFPIRDARGRVIGFGGRVLGDDTPKYLNSPETPVFNKGRELYGLYEARQARRQLNQLVVVEGYMDVVALAQHGIDYAVATLGTAVSRAHLERVFRCCARVTFCFDGDRAGRSAAARALEVTMGLMADGRQANFLFLDEGEDPDSLVRKAGREHFEALLAGGQPIADFLFEELSRGIDLGSFDGRARLSKLALPLIGQAPEGVFRQLLLQELSRRTGLDHGTMTQLARQQTTSPAAAPPQREPPAPAQPPPAAQNPTERPRHRPRQASRIEKTPLRAALANLLFHPRLAALAGDLSALQQPETLEGELLLEMLELLQREPDTPTASLLGSWLNTEKHECAARLLGFEDLLEDEQKSQREFLDALERLRKERHRRRLEGELAALGGLPHRSEEQKARYLQLLMELRAGLS
jgi:DNA primase